jgi:hypothetical protein
LMHVFALWTTYYFKSLNSNLPTCPAHLPPSLLLEQSCLVELMVLPRLALPH